VSLSASRILGGKALRLRQGISERIERSNGR